MHPLIDHICSSGCEIGGLRHPYYEDSEREWFKWRLTYRGGVDFVDEYLKRFSTRESDVDFNTRKNISYVPAFAKAAVNEVKDSIFQRISDVTRKGGDESYITAVKGEGGGVDGKGTSMGSFIGTVILPELLPMQTVGVFVDMPPLPGTTVDDQRDLKPYIYHYPVEDILCWDEDNNSFTQVLLRDYVFERNPITLLPIKIVERFRYMWKENGVVYSQFFNSKSEPLENTVQLNLTEIPFVKFQITDSLLRDICDYQIALLNLASSDIAYSLNCNFPFYTEQFDPRVDNLYQRPPGANIVRDTDDSVAIIQPGEVDDAIAAKNYEVKVGTLTGRRVPKGLDMPQYIHPSSEPLEASMRKQKELKEDIRNLLKLAIQGLVTTDDSGERSLEAGLSAIGLELEKGESKIAEIWQMYVDKNSPPPTVKYPEKYKLQTDKDQREESKELADSVKNVSSLTYKREAMKKAVTLRLGADVSSQTLSKIHKELDDAEVIFHSPEELSRDVELGLIDPETASEAKGYPDGSYEKAKIAHAERIQRIAESQAKARGVNDLSGLENASRQEKMDKDEEIVASEKTRGEAK